MFNARLSPSSTRQSAILHEINQRFNRFRSGSETLADALQISEIQLDALLHGEAELSIEQIDTLINLGYTEIEPTLSL